RDRQEIEPRPGEGGGDVRPARLAKPQLTSPALMAISQQLARLTSFRLAGSSISVFAAALSSGSSWQNHRKVWVSRGTSLQVLLEVVERGVEVGSHPELGFPVTARLARPGSLLGFLHVGQRLPVVRDRQFLARLKLLKQFRQTGLGVLERHGRHG